MATGDVIYAHGFEGGDPAKDALVLTTTGGTVTETATNKRTGDYCLRVNRTSNAAVRAESVTTAPNAFPDITKSAWGVHLSCYLPSLPSVSGYLTIFYASVPLGNDAEVRINSSGQVIALFYSGSGVTTGAVVLGTVSAGTRFRIELAIDIVPGGANAKLKGRLDGGTATSEFTQGAPGSGAVISGVNFGCYESTSVTGTIDIYYDDCVITEGYAFPGDYAVMPIRPDTSAADLDTNWSITGGDTKRAQAIDETPPDDVTTYIQSSTSGQTQRIPMSNVTIPGTIKGVAPYIRTGSNSTTGTRNFNTTLRSSGGTDGTAVPTNYDVNGWANGGANKVFINVPGGTGWSQTDLDGIQLKFTKDANTNIVRVSQAYLAVAYQPATDVTPPVPNITIGPSRTKISAQTGKDSTDITVQVDEACQAWKCKVVPATSSTESAGTLIESGGSVAASGTINVNITNSELATASPGDGAKIVKFFFQDLAGNWSV